MSDTAGALLTASLVLLAAGVAGLVLFRRLGFGSVLGLLLVGGTIGPHGLGLATADEQLQHVAELGVVFLLFVIGLEMQPETLWAMRRAVFGLGLLQVLVTGILFAAVPTVFGLPWQSALVLGFGLALSSTAMCVQLLEERGELYSDWGRRAFAILLFQDLAVVPLLAAVPLLAHGEAVGIAPFRERLSFVLLGLGGLYAAGRFLLPRLLDLTARERNSEAFTGLAVLAVIASAWAMEFAGLSPALGAFVMGLLLSRSRYHHQLEAEVAPFKGILMGLFFLAVGMSLDVKAIVANAHWLTPTVLAMMAAKAVLIFLLARGFGLDRPGALRASALLSQGGEFAFVLFAAAASRTALAPAVADLGVLVISASMLLTPLALRLADAAAARLEVPRPPVSVEQTIGQLRRHVVLCGFGRVGGTVGLMLDVLGIPFLAIDQDPVRVETGRRAGRNIIYGNAADPRVLKLAGVGRSALVLVTLDNPAVAERVVSAVHNFYPDIPIIARARDLEARDRMLRAGVTEAVPEAIELAITLGAVTLRQLGVAEADTREIAEQLRERAFAVLRRHPTVARRAEAARLASDAAAPAP